jgi:hypothetical protein
MKFIKYYFLKTKFNIFKHLSTSPSFDLKDASCMFSKNHQNKWYTKYAAPLSFAALLLAVASLVIASALIHFLKPAMWLHVIIDTIALLLTASIFALCLYVSIFGMLSGFLKEYLDWQINKKYGSDVNAYVHKMNSELTELEKFNIVKEKEQLEELLTPISTEVKQTHKKKMKI